VICRGSFNVSWLIVSLRAKYQPYDALRQKFWRTYLKQYDADDNNVISRIEITSMLDSLGSTLSGETIDKFFTRYGKRPQEDEITIDEAIICLEEELGRPQSEKKRLDASEDPSVPDTSSPATPALQGIQGGVGSTAVDEGETPLHTLRLALEQIDFSGPAQHPSAVQPGQVSDEPQSIQQGQSQLSSDQSSRQGTVPVYPTEPSQQPLLDAAAPYIDSMSTRVPVGYHATAKPERQPSASEDADETSGSSGSGSEEPEPFERVINIKNCPLCHRPRMKSRAEMDIVTHLAICASKDWARVDQIMVGNFVTATQAQRKWYTKLITKVSSGDYRLGAVSTE
jgi:phosphatidylserine decarboxylase